MQTVTRRSFLKWAGGKGKKGMIEAIQSAFPVPLAGTRLIEPFVGAGNVFLGTNYQSYLLNDRNDDLITTFSVVKMFPDPLVDQLKSYWTASDEDGYYRIRDEFNRMKIERPHDAVRKAAMFIYLNRHAFNGLCRYNKSGGFNAPCGKYESPYLPLKEIELFSQKSFLARFTVGDFGDAMWQARSGDHIICDPPYAPISGTSNFAGYSAGGFSMDDQVRLAKIAEEQRERGVHVAICNNDLPTTRAIYCNADRFIELSVQRSISAKADSREKVNELIAVYEGRA